MIDNNKNNNSNKCEKIQSTCFLTFKNLELQNNLNVISN